MVNTGDGKGKSTAAFGVVVRAVARDWQVAVVQFLKSGEWRVGEEAVCRDRLGVDWWAIGEGFTWDSDDLSRDQAVAEEAWAHAKATIAAGRHRLVVLDEITYPINWGWLDGGEVAAAITERPATVNVVCTGRAARARRRGRHRHRDAQDQARLRHRRHRQEGDRLLSVLLEPARESYPGEDGGAPRPALVWRLPDDTIAIASAVFGGGLGPREWVVNAQVALDYGDDDPAAHVAAIATGLGLDAGRGVGLLTAVPVLDAKAAADEGVECAATVGLSTPTWAAAADGAWSRWAPATINLVCWVPAPLADAALVNAVVTATEAKTQALARAACPAPEPHRTRSSSAARRGAPNATAGPARDGAPASHAPCTARSRPAPRPSWTIGGDHSRTGRRPFR